MKIKEKLEILKHYYDSTRAAGHTTLMKKGINNYEEQKLVLVYNKNHGKELGLNLQEIISWLNPNLKGHNAPLAIDNAVMHEMLDDTLSYINELEKDREQLNKIKAAL